MCPKAAKVTRKEESESDSESDEDSSHGESKGPKANGYGKAASQLMKGAKDDGSKGFSMSASPMKGRRGSEKEGRRGSEPYQPPAEEF
jgi:hypothetical protein